MAGCGVLLYAVRKGGAGAVPRSDSKQGLDGWFPGSCGSGGELGASSRRTYGGVKGIVVWGGVVGRMWWRGGEKQLIAEDVCSYDRTGQSSLICLGFKSRTFANYEVVVRTFMTSKDVVGLDETTAGISIVEVPIGVSGRRRKNAEQWHICQLARRRTRRDC